MLIFLGDDTIVNDGVVRSFVVEYSLDDIFIAVSLGRIVDIP